MTPESENNQGITLEESEAIIGDSAEPKKPKTIKIKPKWQEEARRRPAVQREFSTHKVKFLATKDKEHIDQIVEEIKKVAKGEIGEVHIVFKEEGEMEEMEWDEVKDSV